MAPGEQFQHESLRHLPNTCDRRQEAEATKMLPLPSGSTPWFIAVHETPQDSVAGWRACCCGATIGQGSNAFVPHLFVARIHSPTRPTGLFLRARAGGH